MSFRLLRSSSGFTLIELIVSIAILAMLSMAFISQSEVAAEKQKRQTFTNSIETMMGALRAARTSAITNKTVAGGVVPDGGYGVHFAITDTPPAITITEFIDDRDETNAATPDRMLSFDAGGDPLDKVLNRQTIKSFWQTESKEANFVGGTALPYDGKSLTVIFLPGEAEMHMNDNDATNAFRSTRLEFRYRQTIKSICLHRVSKFIEPVTGIDCQ